MRKILSTEKGPSSVKALAWIMFGGLEDGAKTVDEPLLDSDITCDLNQMSALIAIHFGITASKKPYQWTDEDRRGFDNLEQALADAEKAMQAQGIEDLEKAMRASTLGSSPKRKRNLKKKKRQAIQDQSELRRRSAKNDPFTIFVKAAKFVRGIGAGTIHPSAKLRLFGLLMQAQRGNVPDGNLRRSFDLPGLKGAALALQNLKLKAWRAEKDKSSEDAMKEYVELVTSLAPQWKVARLLGAHDSIKDDKPRPMMWVLKVKYRRLKTSSLTSSSGYSMSRFRAASIEVLQSSNATSARLWAEEGVALEKEKRTGKGEEGAATTDSASGALGGEGEAGQDEDDFDLFMANIPRDWALSDCIVDKSKFETLEDQRAHFRKRMKEMADKKDGWKFYSKTKSPWVPDSEQYVA